MFKNIVILVLVIVAVFFAWIACTIKLNAMQSLYEDYNNITIYEDGSYRGKDRDGVVKVGCIKDAQCND